MNFPGSHWVFCRDSLRQKTVKFCKSRSAWGGTRQSARLQTTLEIIPPKNDYLMEKSGVIKISRILLVPVNICMKLHNNPTISGWDITVWKKCWTNAESVGKSRESIVSAPYFYPQSHFWSLLRSFWTQGEINCTFLALWSCVMFDLLSSLFLKNWSSDIRKFSLSSLVLFFSSLALCLSFFSVGPPLAL